MAGESAGDSFKAGPSDDKASADNNVCGTQHDGWISLGEDAELVINSAKNPASGESFGKPANPNKRPFIDRLIIDSGLVPDRVGEAIVVVSVGAVALGVGLVAVTQIPLAVIKTIANRYYNK